MATQTEHYKFTKPLETEKVDVNVINQNMDIADSSLKTLSDEVALCAKNADITTSYASSASLSGNNLLIKSKSGATLSTVDLSGFSNGPSCSKDVSTVVAMNDVNLITSGAVYTAIENSVGTVNTILNSI